MMVTGEGSFEKFPVPPAPASINVNHCGEKSAVVKHAGTGTGSGCTFPPPSNVMSAVSVTGVEEQIT